MKMIYKKTQRWFPCTQVCKRRKTPQYIYKVKVFINWARSKKQNKLHKNTHIKKRVFIPVVIIISKMNLFWFQP